MKAVTIIRGRLAIPSGAEKLDVWIAIGEPRGEGQIDGTKGEGGQSASECADIPCPTAPALE